jgi:hypothetical protein
MLFKILSALASAALNILIDREVAGVGPNGLNQLILGFSSLIE